MYLVKYIKGDSLLHRTDPRVKLLLVGMYTGVIFHIHNYVVLFSMLLMLLGLWRVSRLPLKSLKSYIPFFLPLMIFLVVMQGFFIPGNRYLITVAGRSFFSLKGLVLGLFICFRLFILILLMPTLMLSTETDSLILGLIGLKVPYRVAFLITTALNQIPALREDIQSIINAQKMRGFAAFDKGRLIQKIRSYPVLVVPLIIGAMRRAQTMGVAMDARAYGASKKRTYRKALHITKRDYILFASMTILAALLVISNGYLNIHLSWGWGI